MGNPSINRRDFFRSFTIKKEQPVTDPLFEKYARKSLGPRVYKNEFVSFTAFQETENNLSSASLRVGNVTSGLDAYTGSWGVAEALHLLRRTGFGFKKAQVDSLVAAGSVSAAVNLVLNIDNTVPAPPVNWYNPTYADEGGLAYGADCTTTAFNSTSVGQTSNVYRKEGLRRWLLGLSLNQDITIREKMVMFWYHFIPVDFEAVYQSPNTYVNTNSARICYQYMKMFRDNATGNFKSLIRNMATQPAMMFYLNNHANTASAPDENFARELMELFTLGKDPLSQYTQADVVAAAKTLTGWRVQNLNLNTTATAFDSTKHSTGSKTFSPFFNNTIIPGTGAGELDDLITMIFSKQQVVSEYICRRLYRFFVYYDIDANIEANVITPLAQTFVANNWEILPVLKQLFNSTHFYDAANRGVYIKSPLDLVAGTLRCFNLNHNVSDNTNYQAQYMLWANFLDTYTLPMEQRYGQVPNVAGWNAFCQTPAYHEYWINTNTIQKRFYWLTRIFDGYSYTNNGITTTIKVDCIAWVQQFANATIRDPNLLVTECIKYLLPIDLSQVQKNSIKQQTLLYQQITDSYWTSAWDAYIATPSNNATVKDRLKNLLYTLVQLAEFQLM